MTMSVDANPMRTWFRAARLNNRMMSALSVQLKALGLSVAQFDVLSTLSEREGISQSELADRLYVTKGNVSGLVDRMVEAQLVERRAIAGDRRSYALHFMPEGKRLLEAGLTMQNSFVGATLGALPERDVVELERIIIAWRDIVREMQEIAL